MECLNSCTWKGFSASVPGSGHIRRDIPCQDASLIINSDRPAIIVCDGRGSATYSHLGAKAAVKIFRTQIAILEPIISSILDCENSDRNAWRNFCRIICRTLTQVKIELSEEYHLPEDEFDFTVAFAVTGKKFIGCCQVGDGAIVLRQNGNLVTAFKPNKGEFSNQTVFLRSGCDLKGDFQSEIYAASENSGIAIISDGPAHMMFKLPEMIPGKVFDAMFNDLINNDLNRQDLLDYLTDRHWLDDPRGTDDRSLALLVPGQEGHKTECFSESGSIENSNTDLNETTPLDSDRTEPSIQSNETIQYQKTLQKECKIMKKSVCLTLVLLLAAFATVYTLYYRSTTQTIVSLETKMLQLVVNNIIPQGSLGKLEKIPLAKLPKEMHPTYLDDAIKQVHVIKFDINNDGEKEWFVDYYGNHGNNSEGYDVFTRHKGKWQKCGDLQGLYITPMKHNGRTGIFQKYRCGGFTRIYTFYELIEGKLVGTVTIEAERDNSEKSSTLNIKVLSNSQNSFDHLF